MKFNQTTIELMFGSKASFAIPIYQRAYSWDISNWNIFLEDIIEQIGKSNGYSYGNILLETLEEGRKYEIIDGQQRLTTLILFMRALINTLTNKGCKKNIIEEIEEDYIIRKGIIKLRPIENDRACFDTIVVQNNTYPANSSSQDNMIECKDYFLRELNKMDLPQLLELKDIIGKTSINMIELSGKKESALMFELQNNRGKNLTNLEKLKSYFMYQMYVNSTSDETDYNVEIVSNNFKDIYKTIYDIKDLDEDNILIYHCNAYLGVSFNYKNLENIKNELKNQSDKVKWVSDFTLKLSKSFHSLKRLQSSTSHYYKCLRSIIKSGRIPFFVYPFIIKGYEYYGDDESKIDILLHIMEILSFRYHLIGSRAELDSRLSDILRKFDGNLQALRDSLKQKLNDTWYWSDARMNEFLKGWMYENPVVRYVLWQYEDSIQNKGYSIGSYSIENINIEHISPQNPPMGESIASGYDVNEDNCYSEIFIQKELNCIGNLMLISGSHNSMIGNKPFEEKLNTYLSNPHMNQQIEIPSFLNNNIKEWKTAQIEKRKEKILSFAVPRWSFDDVKIK